MKELDQKDILLVFPQESVRCTTVRVLKTPKTDSSIRKVFLQKSVALMLREQKATPEELKAMIGDEDNKLKLNSGETKEPQGDAGHAQANRVTDVYSHIIDEDRRRNAALFEEAFYGKKNLDPQMRPADKSEAEEWPDDVDAELIAKVLANPEMKALLMSLAKTVR